MKFWRLFGFSLLLILGLLIAGVAYFALTETGLQWLFAQITRAVPGELQAQQVEGRLGKAVTLRGVRYRTAEFALEIEHIDFSWRAGALWRATLWVEQLHLWGVTWRQLGPAAPRAPEEAITLPEVQLPLKVRAESIRVQDLSLLAYGASPVVIEAITFQGYFEDQILQLTKLGVSAPEGQIQVRGMVVLHEDYPLDLATRWRVQVPELETLIGMGKVKGDLRRLTLQQTLQAPLQLQLRGSLWDLVDDLHWALILDMPESDLQRLHPQWPAVRLGMSLRGAGGIERFKIQGAYQLQEAQVGKIQGEFSGEQVAPAHWILHQFNLQQVAGKARIAAHGDVVLKEGQPHISLNGQWQDLAWPWAGTALVFSDKGQVVFGGHPGAYRLQVNAALAGENLPAGEWSLVGAGDTTQFQLASLQARLLDGALHGTGNVRWDPALTWQLHLDGEALNPAKKWLEWPGELGFRMATRGTLHDDGRVIAIDLQALAGSLRGYPVSAQGEVQLQNAAWQIKDLRLRSGASWLSVGGRVDKHLALDWQLNSPDLAQLLPTGEGHLAGEGRLRGRVKQPKVKLRLQGESLAYQEARLAFVKVDTNLDLEGKQPSQIGVNATGLAFDTQTFRSLNLQGSGVPSQHVLHLAVTEKSQRSLTLQAQGSWREEAWQGEFQKARITDPVSGSWEMIRSTPLTVSRRRIDLAPWCWRQQTAQLCLGGSWQEGQAWEASFKSANFPLGTLAPFLPEELALEGTLESKAQIRGSAHRLEQASVQLNISAGRLIQAVPDRRILILPHQGLQAELRLDEEAGKGRFEWLLGELGETRVGASLRLPPGPLDLTALEEQLPLFGGWWQGQGWEARLMVEDFPLATLAPFLPEQMNLEGAVGINAQLRGEGHYLEQASAQLNASPGRLLQEMPEQTLVLLHQGLQAELRLDKGGGSGDLEWLLAELGTASLGTAPLKVALRLPPAPLDLRALDRLPLDGEITAALNELAFLKLLLPEIQAAQGQLRIDLALGGWVREPQILGQIGLHNGRARVPSLGLELTRIQLLAEAREIDAVTFTGEVHSGEGQLTLQGQVDLDPAAGWPGHVSIVGERFEAAKIPEVGVFISPRLQVTLAERQIQIEGEVTVPEARLSPVDIRQRGGVSVSEDVLIISEERKVPPEGRGMPAYARVRVVLGDRVNVQAYGFTGRIAGSVLVTDAPERRTRGSGELRIVKGQYAAYGVQLDVQEGRVIFVGPIDDPRVSIRAVRQAGNVRAGVQVQGPASAPELTLFSEPTLNEENILAYLILGRPLRTASSKEGEMLANAAVSISLSGGNLLARRIGRTFGLKKIGIEEVGIEEVGVDAERDPQRAALMLGRYLSPRLYVGYGIGIFQRFNAFRMRYLLTESWSLQAETGLESSLDLFYNLER